MNVSALIIGLIAFVLVVYAFQNKHRDKILGILWISQLLFIVHFAILGAWTAVAMNLLGAVRTYIFKTKKKWASNVFWPYVFVVLFWIATYFTWIGWFSMFPAIAMTIETFGLWMRNEKFLRILNIFPHPFWFTYNLLVASYPGMLTEVFVLGSVLVAIYRFDLKKSKKSSI